MIIDNGTRHRLIIDGVFEGECGLSRNTIAFLPNRGARPALAARGALLDGEPIILRDVAKAEDGRSYVARFEVMT